MNNDDGGVNAYLDKIDAQIAPSPSPVAGEAVPEAQEVHDADLIGLVTTVSAESRTQTVLQTGVLYSLSIVIALLVAAILLSVLRRGNR